MKKQTLLITTLFMILCGQAFAGNSLWEQGAGFLNSLNGQNNTDNTATKSNTSLGNLSLGEDLTGILLFIFHSLKILPEPSHC